MEALIAAMLADSEVRLPGARRLAIAREAQAGINVSDATLAALDT